MIFVYWALIIFHIVYFFKAQKRIYVKEGGVIKHMVCSEIERRGHKALVENYLKTKTSAKLFEELIKKWK